MDDFFGDKYTLEEWQEHIDCGGIKSYDGQGYYGTETEEWTEYEVFSTEKPEGATHVWWYNK